MVLRQALWRAAIIHFIKCFGHSKSRFKLNPKQIYKGDSLGKEVFHYFENLRNKHFIHDENPYSQTIPGAVLNRDDKPHKIAKIVCLDVSGETLTQANYGNLHQLVTLARDYICAEFESLCGILTSEYEAKPYHELLAMEEANLKVPTADDVRKTKSSF